ncbi:adenosine receptor A2b-like [Clytia hemisphaerica]|uniref:adenosine receptor A2b-like n=1 Tax=Clytia hemisphaerica TaxID=252671 RepID=UPI0034D3BE6D
MNESFNISTTVATIYPNNPHHEIGENGLNNDNPIQYPLIFWIFLGMESLLIIMANAMLIWLFANNRPLRTQQNYFVMSLSISDLLVGLTIAPCEYCALLRIMAKGPSAGVGQCSLFCGSVLSFNMLASTFNLVLIALDRFVSIMRPFEYPKYFTKSRARLFIFVAWMWTFFCVCMPFAWQINPNIDPMARAKINLYYGITLFSMVLILGLLIGAAYFAIIRTIQSKMKGVKGPPSNKKGIKVCVMVAISFFLCWIPTCITELIIVDQKVYPEAAWMNTAYFILLLNPCLDPLMYAYYRRDFRRELSLLRDRRWKSVKTLYDRFVMKTKGSGNSAECEHLNNNLSPRVTFITDTTAMCDDL